MLDIFALKAAYLDIGPNFLVVLPAFVKIPFISWLGKSWVAIVVVYLN